MKCLMDMSDCAPLDGMPALKLVSHCSGEVVHRYIGTDGRFAYTAALCEFHSRD